MVRLTSLLSLLFISASTALPFEEPQERAATTCGSTAYTAAQVNSAAQQAYSYYSRGQTVGSNDYPHTFNNREGFDFAVGGPYQEFPMLASKQVYTGGSPGPDRVVINTSGRLAGAITHTGASGNNFVGCTGTS
ncbi:hypothetical protein HYFRA_00006007 [Hymenoscyphus fraxineus]|uniref:ribonuclease T1 n=1 Tax=Hymenoscyphus fraxineus TaxID=746836 RepID=A0A9N9PP92_9HELO|nr:hypothetical protein HYFRA_00006007 [Hymenoscyphus fraxineus]